MPSEEKIETRSEPDGSLWAAASTGDIRLEPPGSYPAERTRIVAKLVSLTFDIDEMTDHEMHKALDSPLAEAKALGISRQVRESTKKALGQLRMKGQVESRAAARLSNAL